MSGLVVRDTDRSALLLCRHPGDVVPSTPFFEALAAESVQVVGQRSNIFFGGRVVKRPVSRVLFRPEEVHAGSTPRPIGGGASNFTVRIADHRFGRHGQHFFIPHHHFHQVPTIKARSFDPDCLAWKEPADRQRFKSSLSEPLLLPVDRDPVLGWQVVERWKGHQ